MVAGSPPTILQEPTMTHSPAALTALEALGYRPAAAPFGRIMAAVAAARARQIARRSYRHLLDAEPHVLDDIGLTRADVQRALDACSR
jgi:uncharacterized protein YjiS (DUF1127 family)